MVAATKPTVKTPTEIVKTDGARGQIVLAEGLEGMLDEDAGFGVDDMGVEDVALPYLYILQKMSPVCEEGHTAYINGARPGMIFNNVTQEIYEGRDTGILFVPCHYERRYVEWVDRDKGGGWVADYEPNSDILTHTIKNDRGKPIMKGSGNLIVETAYHYGLFKVDDEDWGQAVIPLKSTGLKYNKKWNNELMTTRNPANRALLAPRWLFPYRITTFVESKNNNSWSSPKIERLDHTVDKSLYVEAKKFNELARTGLVRRSAETMGEPASDGHGGGGSAEDIPF